MANLTDTTGCGGNGRSTGTTLLPASPFYAPRYHFGMLLGVDDFESEQAYHRGKGRLHNAWLHGEGVVWGFGVDLPDVEGRPGVPRGEVRVHPGFALDAAGRELHLDGAACVALAAWYEAHRDEPEVAAAVREQAGVVRLDLHVVARFKACLARPVPSITEPCNGAGGDVAYSRTQETVELLLRPGAAPPRPMPYHRLRLLFALEGPRVEQDGVTVTTADEEVLDARGAVLALPPEEQPAAYLDAFRRFAAKDEMELRPAALPDGGGSTLFPADDGCVVVLADVLTVTLTPTGEKGALEFAGAVVDNTVRPSHVATSTIQELLCGPLATCLCPPDGSPPAGSPPVESPPAESPPYTSPPDEPPPDESPPEESPPEESPPDESPPEESPPEESPPEESPPVESPPVDELPDVALVEDEWLPPTVMARDSVAADFESFSATDAEADAGGPRISPRSLRLEGEAVILAADRRLSKASVAPHAFSVSAYDLRDGWHTVEIRAARIDRTQRAVRLELATGFGGNLVRVIARGTGPTPLLGTNLVPLAGETGGPPGGTENGHDFVIMLKRSET